MKLIQGHVQKEGSAKPGRKTNVIIHWRYNSNTLSPVSLSLNLSLFPSLLLKLSLLSWHRIQFVVKNAPSPSCVCHSGNVSFMKLHCIKEQEDVTQIHTWKKSEGKQVQLERRKWKKINRGDQSKEKVTVINEQEGLQN